MANATDQDATDEAGRLPDEPEAAFRRFLAYRNLGPSRTLDAAYRAFPGVKKGVKRCRAPGQWQRDSVAFHWPARALAWDVSVLAQKGQAIVVRFVDALEFATTKALTALALETTKPTDWAEALKALDIIGSFVPSAAVRRVAEAQAVENLTDEELMSIAARGFVEVPLPVAAPESVPDRAPADHPAPARVAAVGARRVCDPRVVPLFSSSTPNGAGDGR